MSRTVKDYLEDLHRHKLSLCKMVGDDGEEDIKCIFCKYGVDRKSGDLVYVCKSSCDDRPVLHKSCGDLDFLINHSFHYSHGPLRLTKSLPGMYYGDYSCASCHRKLGENALNLFYKCNKCNFHMDVECALLMPMPMTTGEESIQHTTHPHPLLLHDGDDNRVSCYACELEISGGDEAKYYACAHCNYFLHKSCAELPLEFPRHPLHPRHSTLSFSLSVTNFTCKICEKDNTMSSFHFKCDDHRCSFRICWTCIIRVKKKNIKYEDHDHLLCYVDAAKKNYHCNAYDAYCTRPDLMNINIGELKEFKRTKSSIFKCPDCNFMVHFLCGSLPSTIKHESHIHSLTLLDSLIEDDNGEYYCDICETQRDPRIRLYHCHECKFFAHVHCVISEIEKVVRGDLKGVELKALGKDSWSHQIEDELVEPTTTTLKDLINRLTEDGKLMFTLYFKLPEATSSPNMASLKPRRASERFVIDIDEINEILSLSRFSASNFETLMKEFDESIRNEKFELKSSDLEMKMVKVTGYMIPYPLVGVFQTLLNQYGDIANPNIKSLEIKSFCYFVLCQVVKRMSATLVKDITKQLLREWFLHLRFLYNRGFKIGFARVQFERLVDGYLGFQAKILKDEIPKILESKLAEIQRGLEKCKEYQGSTEKSEYMKYCLEKASDSKMWDYAFDRSFKDDVETLPIPRPRWSRW